MHFLFHIFWDRKGGLDRCLAASLPLPVRKLETREVGLVVQGYKEGGGSPDLNELSCLHSMSQAPSPSCLPSFKPEFVYLAEC